MRDGGRLDHSGGLQRDVLRAEMIEQPDPVAEQDGRDMDLLDGVRATRNHDLAPPAASWACARERRVVPPSVRDVVHPFAQHDRPVVPHRFFEHLGVTIGLTAGEAVRLTPARQIVEPVVERIDLVVRAMNPSSDIVMSTRTVPAFAMSSSFRMLRAGCSR
jgi:hypothetical protein